MSKTKKKTKNNYFLLVFAQILLIIAGLAFQLIPFFSGTSASAYVWIGRSFTMLTYILLALYCIFGVRKSRALFVISILAFAVSILFTIITEGGSNVILLLTGLEVIFVVLFSQNLCKKRRSICLLAFVFALAIAVAVFKSILFDPNSQNVLSTMFNIWSNVVTSLTLALCYLVDVKRQRKLENQKVETETKPSNKKEPK